MCEFHGDSGQPRINVRVIGLGTLNLFLQLGYFLKRGNALEPVAHRVLDIRQDQQLFRAFILHIQIASVCLHQRVGDRQRAIDLVQSGLFIDIVKSPPAVCHRKVQLIGNILRIRFGHRLK